jgi:Protein of unknown function (DUF2785)
VPAATINNAALILVTLAALANTADADAICQNDAETQARWQAVYAAPNGGEPNELALELVACLASPNPQLRDRFAYQLLTYWLRGEVLTFETVDHLRARIQPWLMVGSGETNSDSAYGRAFAALVLSEVVRYDSIHASFDTDVLAGLLNDGIAMLVAERDFRGLDPTSGWIHTIAHGSDLLWRFASHPAVDVVQQRAILDGIAAIVAPSGNHPYVFNEFDRMARVVAAILQRDVLGSDALVAWVDQFASPRHMSSWSDAFASPAGMAELHNTKNFLRALLAVAGAEEDTAVVDSIEAALAKLP